MQRQDERHDDNPAVVQVSAELNDRRQAAAARAAAPTT